MDATVKARKLMDFLDEAAEPGRGVAKEILTAELGKLHLQNPRHIKDEIRQIIERKSVTLELDERPR